MGARKEGMLGETEKRMGRNSRIKSKGLREGKEKEKKA